MLGPRLCRNPKATALASGPPPSAPTGLAYDTSLSPTLDGQQYQWAPYVVIIFTTGNTLPYEVHIEADYGGAGFVEIASYNGYTTGAQNYGDGGASFDSTVRYQVRLKKNGQFSSYAGPTANFTPRRYLPYGIFAFSDQTPKKVVSQPDADSTDLVGLGSYGTRAAPLIKAKITISTETKVAADTANYSQFIFADQIIKAIPSGGFSVDGEWAANGGSPGVTPTGQDGASGGGGACTTTGVVTGGTGGMGGSGTNGSPGDDLVSPGTGGTGYGSTYDYPDAVKGGDGGGNYNQGSVASGGTGFGGGGGGGGAPGGSQPTFTPGGGGGGAGQFTGVFNYFWDSSGSGIFIGARGGPGADSSAGTFSAGGGGGGGSVNIATKANSTNGGTGNIYVDGGTPGVDFFSGAYAQAGSAGAIGFWMISQDDATITLSDQGTFWDNNFNGGGPP